MKPQDQITFLVNQINKQLAGTGNALEIEAKRITSRKWEIYPLREREALIHPMFRREKSTMNDTIEFLQTLSDNLQFLGFTF